MTLTPPQWTMAFAAALATHTLAAALLPQALSRRSSDPAPPPEPIRLSLATPPAPAPVAHAPVVTPPTPARPTPPVARQPETEAAPPPAPKVVEPPQPAPVPATVKQVPFTQRSVAAVNPSPVATQQAPSRESTVAVNGDNSTPEVTEEPPANVTTAAVPTSVLDAVDLAQLQSQYGQTAHQWLNKHKRYPHRAEYLGHEGTVLVTFVVNRHGEVLSYALERSSGNTLLDKEALALIKRAQPLPVFPDALAEAKDTITVLVKIPFELR